MLRKRTVFVELINLYSAKGTEYDLASKIVKMKTANNRVFSGDLSNTVKKSILATKDVLGFYE